MWDTSGSTNFDSVRPLSYSEVVWEASCSAHTDLVHFHRLLPEMPTDNISISRRIFSLFASALLSPSPSTMSEVTGQLRWKTMLENRIVKKLFYNLRWENILLHHSSCVDVSLTWGKEIPVWPENMNEFGQQFNVSHLQVRPWNHCKTLSHRAILGHPRASGCRLHPDRGWVLCWDKGTCF